ncbi:uncharacterized protein B0P05DRAFT_558318 [Gilbertella persicaria]|uniref:uncharacterized protein n=1 Tax=Gilbertella persicaria TaxID=101096 RepID=UPI00221EE60A|nr:uncharacterized protein B0P05DRAFT_558318 [Gilbertella persicaria]KAI8059987.1 hypothetical protein B0P05DRAFT_558318 [Gilbertella persicaria]
MIYDRIISLMLEEALETVVVLFLNHPNPMFSEYTQVIVRYNTAFSKYDNFIFGQF